MEAVERAERMAAARVAAGTEAARAAAGTAAGAAEGKDSSANDNDRRRQMRGRAVD